MAVGCPRTVSLSEKDMIALGEEMVAYVKKNRKKMLHLSEWYTIEKAFTYNEWKTFIQKEEFLPYYEIALKIVGMQYLDKTSNVRDSISQRWQRIYFPDLKEGEDADKEADEARKARSLKDEAETMADIKDIIERNKRIPK